LSRRLAQHACTSVHFESHQCDQSNRNYSKDATARRRWTSSKTASTDNNIRQPNCISSCTARRSTIAAYPNWSATAYQHLHAIVDPRNQFEPATPTAWCGAFASRREKPPSASPKGRRDLTADPNSPHTTSNVVPAVGISRSNPGRLINLYFHSLLAKYSTPKAYTDI
jgi:hypothetical protein